jgi:serine beta-lactamase-like protein LACTB
VGVSKNGKIIYSKGFGYSDVENNVKANPHTVVRIASISKPITCTLAARLFQEGKLDIDKPINYYLNDLPPLKWNGQNVKITARQLMCHTAGIRHYEKFNKKENNKASDVKPQEEVHVDDTGNDKSYKNVYPVKTMDSGDSLFSEFFFNKPFKTTREALEIFINDDLVFEPGKGYLYSTYGYTLLSAVLEKSNSNNSKFSDMLVDLFKRLEMNETYLDYNSPLITYRSK